MRSIAGISAVMPDDSMSVLFPNKQPKSVAGAARIRKKGILHGSKSSVAANNLRVKITIPKHEVFDCGQQIRRAHKVIFGHHNFERGTLVPVSAILDDRVVSVDDC